MLLSRQRSCCLRLFYSEVSVDTSIASGAGEVLVLSVRNMKFRPSITILLGKAKVNDEQLQEKEMVQHNMQSGVCVREHNRPTGVNVLDCVCGRKKLLC